MSTEHQDSDKEVQHSSSFVILQSLAPIATSLTASQLEPFTLRLAEVLFRLADQSVRPEEAGISAHSYNHLKKNSADFCRLASKKLNEQINYEFKVLENGANSTTLESDATLALVTFDEMENKVLLESLIQAIELDNADELVKLNLRICHLLKINPVHIKYNPFRPEVFLKAIYKAWCEFEPATESHHLVLRILRPDIFIQFNPIFHELNNALIERGILPKANDLFRLNKARGQSPSTAALLSQNSADPFFESKIKGILFANPSRVEGMSSAHESGFRGNAQNAGPESGHFGMGNQETITIKREFFDYLTGMQANVISAGPAQTTIALRSIVSEAPENTFTQIDSNTIELLAKIFDYVFSDPHIPAAIKGLIGQLQIPTLKAALIDREFFFAATHPARVLIDTLAKASMTWNPEKGVDDPLYQLFAQSVTRVQQEFEHQLDLFSSVTADILRFIDEEATLSEKAIEEPIAQATQQEKIRQAREFAINDVATRLETGEVAGFIEAFLEQQWVEILTIAHTVKEQKPQALERTLKTMDDLIWSVKTKNSIEERRELVTKLPALLSSLNTWLDSIKWEDPDRAAFFAKLAERHASMARAPLQVSARRQIEIAVNVAQKASEHSLKKRKNEIDRDLTLPDQFIFFIDQLERGNWFEFHRREDEAVPFKLAWISPRRTRFIFTGRPGHAAFSMSSDELADLLRSGKAQKINDEPVVERALQAVIEARE